MMIFEGESSSVFPFLARGEPVLGELWPLPGDPVLPVRPVPSLPRGLGVRPPGSGLPHWSSGVSPPWEDGELVADWSKLLVVGISFKLIGW